MNTKQLSRRDVLKALSAAAAAGTLSACATMEDKKTIGKVVVVGAGYGGATAAKYLRMWSGARSMSRWWIPTRLLYRARYRTWCSVDPRRWPHHG